MKSKHKMIEFVNSLFLQKEFIGEFLMLKWLKKEHEEFFV